MHGGGGAGGGFGGGVGGESKDPWEVSVEIKALKLQTINRECFHNHGENLLGKSAY